MEAHNEPRYSYTVGLSSSYNHPEILIIGLPFQQAQLLFERIATQISNGFVYLPRFTYPGILDSFECAMLEVNEAHFHDYFSDIIELFTAPGFSVLQCVYPAGNNSFPWEDDWPADLSLLQPILDQ